MGTEPQFTSVLPAPGPACSAPMFASARAEVTGTTRSPSSLTGRFRSAKVAPNRFVVNEMSPAIAWTGTETGRSGSAASALDPGLIAWAACVFLKFSNAAQRGTFEQMASSIGPSVWGFEPRFGVPSVITRPMSFGSAAGPSFPPLTQAGSVAQRTASPPMEWAMIITRPGPPSVSERCASQVMHPASSGPMARSVTHDVLARW
jgi:hypothetical protein